MSRHDEVRLADIIESIEAINNHPTRGDLHDGLIYDAVRVRLIEIVDTDHAIVQDVVEHELGPLLGAVRSLSEHGEQPMDDSA